MFQLICWFLFPLADQGTEWLKPISQHKNAYRTPTLTSKMYSQFSPKIIVDLLTETVESRMYLCFLLACLSLTSILSSYCKMWYFRGSYLHTINLILSAFFILQLILAPLIPDNNCQLKNESFGDKVLITFLKVFLFICLHWCYRK